MGKYMNCCLASNSSDEKSDKIEREDAINFWKPMEWEKREWVSELRQNDITMHELNIQRTNDRKITLETQEALEQQLREHEIEEREHELAIRQRELEEKELDLKEKSVLLDIAIQETELSIEARFAGLEKTLNSLRLLLN